MASRLTVPVATSMAFLNSSQLLSLAVSILAGSKGAKRTSAPPPKVALLPAKIRLTTSLPRAPLSPLGHLG